MTRNERYWVEEAEEEAEEEKRFHTMEGYEFTPEEFHRDLTLWIDKQGDFSKKINLTMKDKGVTSFTKKNGTVHISNTKDKDFEKIAEKDKVIIKDWIQGITKLGPFSPGKSLSDKEQLEDAVVILEVKEPKKYATRKGENLYITKKEIGYQKDDIIYFTIRKGFAFEPTFKLHFAWFDEDYQYDSEGESYGHRFGSMSEHTPKLRPIVKFNRKTKNRKEGIVILYDGGKHESYPPECFSKKGFSAIKRLHKTYEHLAQLSYPSIFGSSSGMGGRVDYYRSVYGLEEQLKKDKKTKRRKSKK